MTRLVAAAKWAAIFLPAVAVYFALEHFTPSLDDKIAAAKADLLSHPVVRVQLEKGHGSAVHIGNGYYLTAAHVSAEKPDITLRTDGGEEAKAEVLWYSRKHDIALMKSNLLVRKANLECRRPAFKEVLELRGNPLNLEHISTWSRVAGNGVSLEGAWDQVLPLDGAIAGGMSGGAAFDMDGDLVGINVGAAVQPMGFSGTFVGIAYIVPADVICGLMGLDT